MILFNVKCFLLVGNPFFEAYLHSDLLGKAIFLSLIALSIATWALLFHKIALTRQVQTLSSNFKKRVLSNKRQILTVENGGGSDPFSYLHAALKTQTTEILNKNHHFSREKEKSSYLSPSDIDVVEAHLAVSVDEQTQELEKHLYILATVVTLAPFLGLLGTVWGILSTFSEMQAHVGGNSNQMVLSGLSLALATTVLGLVDAIPALIGYSYLKNVIRRYRGEMESFSHEMLTSVELQYRRVE